MHTEQLRKCLELIGYTYISENYSFLEIILNEEIELGTIYLNPFIEEMNKNLMDVSFLGHKVDVIKTYIMELKPMLTFYSYLEYRLFEGELTLIPPYNKKYKHTNEMGIAEDLDEFDNYVINSWHFFDRMLTEIQNNCERYDIDFGIICKGLDFSLRNIDCSISLSYLEKKRQKDIEKNTRYFLTTFHDKTEQNRIDYKDFEWIIKEGGRLPFKTNGITVYFYNPQIAYILCNENLIVENLDSKEKISINGNIFTQTYVNSFIEGEKYFDSEYKVSPDTLYGDKADTYVNDLKEKYFHSKIKAVYSGWWYVKNTTFTSLSQKVINEIGYYSGIVSKVEEQAAKYPKLFENFFVNEHELFKRNPNADKSQPYGYTKVEKPEISPEKKVKPKPTIETPELLKVIEMIKSNPYYNGIKGKRLKILFRALTILNILPAERTANSFYQLIKKNLDWDICSYNAMNDYKYNPNIDEIELERMKDDIKTAISTK